MNSLTFALVLAGASPAQAAWRQVQDRISVNRFVERKGRLWALPGMATSDDWGRSWKTDLNEEDTEENTRNTKDVDVASSESEVSIDSQGNLSLLEWYHEEDYEKRIPRNLPWLSRIRFMGKHLLATGAWIDSTPGKSDDTYVLISSQDGRKWTKTTAGPIWGWEHIFVLDPERAWVISGEKKEIVAWRTTDGGRRWEKSTTPGERVDGLFFLNPRHGWVLSATDAGSEVLVTADGGRSWTSVAQVQTSTSTRPTAIVFADSKRGWMAAPGRLWSTHDGGRTWSQELAPTETVPPDEVGLHFGKYKGTEFLLWGSTALLDPPEGEWRRSTISGAIYRLELGKP